MSDAIYAWGRLKAPLRACASMTAAVAALCYASVQPANAAGVLVLPPHLPAACFEQAAADYDVPALVLVAMVRHESRGKNGAVGHNRDGTQDLGVAQHNTASWVPYFESRYGISAEDLRTNPCQSIRAAAYSLRREQNHAACRGQDIWCGVGRYHHPSNASLRAVYVPKVQAALQDMLAKGRF